MTTVSTRTTPPLLTELSAWARALRGAGPDLLALAALIVLTAGLGPTFSLLAIDGRVLHVTEVAMIGVLILALRRLGLRASMEIWRRRLPMIALLVLWMAGAVAFLRGLNDFSVSQLVYDLRLLEYSLLLPIVVLVVDSRERMSLLTRALVLGGLAGTISFGLTVLIARTFGSVPLLSDQEGEIGMAGLYASLFAVWIAACIANGVRVTRAQLALGFFALVLIGLTDKRVAWVAILAALWLVAALGPPGKRLRPALGALATVAVAGVVAFGIEYTLGEPGQKKLEIHSEQTEGAPGGTQLSRELSGLVGNEGVESSNVGWRLAYWGELIERTADQPLLGAGFGPARFLGTVRNTTFAPTPRSTRGTTSPGPTMP